MNYELFDYLCNEFFGATAPRDIAKHKVNAWLVANIEGTAMQDTVFNARREGLEWYEIAKELNMSESKIKSLFQQACYRELAGF